MSTDMLRQEVENKLGKIRAYMEAHGFEGVYVRQRDNFAWLSGGGDNHVVNASEIGFSGLLVTLQNQYLITDHIEVDRVCDEELIDGLWEPRTHNWFDANGQVEQIREIVPGKLGSDIPLPGATVLGNDFSQLRFTLLKSEIERFRILGIDVRQALEDTCREITPGMTEHQIASLLGAKAMAKGIEPSARLVGVDERARKYRHPIPTETELVKYALIVLLGQRGGLYVNCTRLVHFGPVADDLKRNFDAMCQVDATYILNSKVDVPYKKILAAGIAAYNANGYPDEWKNFTQGGVIGYRSREFVVTPETPDKVQNNQAIAWNPTINGVKGEDTILVSDGGIEVISEMPDWPMIEVDCLGDTILRPDILVR
jgi:Xaa-Pro dipeptidase